MNLNTTKQPTNDRHKKKHVTCNKCYVVFERQVRYLKTQPIILCKNCMRKRIYKIAYFPTKKLKEIIRNNGTSDHGTDFEIHLEEMKEELYKREEIKMQKEFDKRNTLY